MFNQKIGYRLSTDNINIYLKQNYKNFSSFKGKTIYKIRPLLQESYGGDKDCSLVSIVTIFAFKDNYKKSFKDIYNEIEKIALKYKYAPDIGTFPIFIKNIIDDYGKINSTFKKIKNIGFDWNLIKKNIDNNIPIILSMCKDGKNYYLNHSVVIIGYREYINSKAKILSIYDNWHQQVSYIDFNKLSRISSINYF